jgi:hypothetical protein
MRSAALVLVLATLCTCGDDKSGSTPADASADASMASLASDSGARPSPDAAMDAGNAAPTTVGNGLVVNDAALQAVMALSPEQRTQPARCDSGPVDGGIGMACTPRGGQCRSAGLTCTADFRGDGGICTRLGCGSAEDCAPGASCCTLLQAGGVSLCFPDACYPTTCLELFQ